MVTTSEAREAFLDFVRKNARSLEHADSGVVEWAITALAKEGMDPHALFERVVYSACPAQGFSIIFDFLKDDSEKRQELLDAVVMTPEWVWSDRHLDAEAVAERFDRAEDFERLLKQYRERLLYHEDEHEVMGYFPSDAYWAKRVGQYIAKKKPDFRRAWDEIKKAWRGFYVGPSGEARFSALPDPDLYLFGASVAALATMVRGLYQILLVEGVIVTFSSEELQHSRMLVRNYQPHSRRRSHPGVAMAWSCFRELLSSDHRIFTIMDEGHMAIKLATHFSQKKSAKASESHSRKQVRVAKA